MGRREQTGKGPDSLASQLTETLPVPHPPCVHIGSRSGEQRGSGWVSPSSFLSAIFPTLAGKQFTPISSSSPGDAHPVGWRTFDHHSQLTPLHSTQAIPTIHFGLILIERYSFIPTFARLHVTLILPKLKPYLWHHPAREFFTDHCGHITTPPSTDHFNDSALLSRTYIMFLALGTPPFLCILLPLWTPHATYHRHTSPSQPSPTYASVLGCWPRHVPSSRPRRNRMPE